MQLIRVVTLILAAATCASAVAAVHHPVADPAADFRASLLSVQTAERLAQPANRLLPSTADVPVQVASTCVCLMRRPVCNPGSEPMCEIVCTREICI